MCECKKNDKYQVWCAYGPKLQSELAADANMTSVRRKRSTSRRRGRPPQMPSRRSPSPHHLEGCYERGHNDGLCQGVYDKGKLDGYNEGRHAHVWHGDEDNEDERPSWTAVWRGRNDSESSDLGSGDSEDTSTSGSSESERSEDSEDGKPNDTVGGNFPCEFDLALCRIPLLATIFLRYCALLSKKMSHNIHTIFIIIVNCHNQFERRGG